MFIVFLGFHYSGFLRELIFLFPSHLLSAIFCVVTIIIYPLFIFKNRKIKNIGIVLGIIIVLVFTIITIVKPKVYDIQFFGGDNYQVKKTDKVYLKDKKYGEARIKYESGLDEYCVDMSFVRGGKTEFVIVSKDGKKREYTIKIYTSKYDINEKK